MQFSSIIGLTLLSLSLSYQYLIICVSVASVTTHPSFTSFAFFDFETVCDKTCRNQPFVISQGALIPHWYPSQVSDSMLSQVFEVKSVSTQLEKESNIAWPGGGGQI